MPRTEYPAVADPGEGGGLDGVRGGGGARAPPPSVHLIIYSCLRNRTVYCVTADVNRT